MEEKGQRFYVSMWELVKLFHKDKSRNWEKIIKITFIKIIFIIWEVSYLCFVFPELDEELYILNNQGLPRFKASLDYII